MDATGTLRLVFDADPWDSTISFAPGIPVARGGTLELTFAPDVNLATQIGRTIDLFDWTGVTPTGAFTVSSPYTWNLSKLYTTGEVTLTAVPEFARRLQRQRHRRRRRLHRLAQRPRQHLHASRLRRVEIPFRRNLGIGSAGACALPHRCTGADEWRAAGRNFVEHGTHPPPKTTLAIVLSRLKLHRAPRAMRPDFAQHAPAAFVAGVVRAGDFPRRADLRVAPGAVAHGGHQVFALALAAAAAGGVTAVGEPALAQSGVQPAP